MTALKWWHYQCLKRIQNKLNRAFEQYGGADERTLALGQKFSAYAHKHKINGKDYYESQYLCHEYSLFEFHF